MDTLEISRLDEEELISDLSDFPVDTEYISGLDSDFSEEEPLSNSEVDSNPDLDRESENSFAPTPGPCGGFFDIVEQEFDTAIVDEDHWGENNNEQVAELENLRREKKQLLLSNNNLKCRADRLKMYADELENEVDKAAMELNDVRSSYSNVRNTLLEVNQQNEVRHEQVTALRSVKEDLEKKLERARFDNEETVKMLDSHKNRSEEQSAKVRALAVTVNKKKKKINQIKGKNGEQRKILIMQSQKIKQFKEAMSSENQKLLEYIGELERERENQQMLLRYHNRTGRVLPKARTGRNGSLSEEIGQLDMYDRQNWDTEEFGQGQKEKKEKGETIVKEKENEQEAVNLNKQQPTPSTPQQQPTPSPSKLASLSPSSLPLTGTATTKEVTTATTATTETKTMENNQDKVVQEQKSYKPFKWSSLNIGDRVCVARENKGNILGVLKYLGPMKGYSGEWVGIELDGPCGKIDGSYNGTRYFTGTPNHGVLCQPACLLPLICQANIGDRVCVNTPGGAINGILRSMGAVKGYSEKDNWAGIELDEPFGTNDGAHGGVRHFTAQPKHGIFVRPYDLFPSVVEVKVGRQVRIARPHGHYSTGTVRWVGQLKCELVGQWVGVELNKPHGWTDGTFDKERYFDAQENFGIFCRPANLLPPVSKMQPGDKVLVDTRIGHWPGTVRYAGTISGQHGQWFGVEFDGPYGNSDGSFHGTRYFRTKSNCGVFAQPHRVQPLGNPEIRLSSAQHKYSTSETSVNETDQKFLRGSNVVDQINTKAEKFALCNYSSLKNPTTWAKEKFLGDSQKRAARMLCWQEDSIHSPLVDFKSTGNKSFRKLIVSKIIHGFGIIQKVMGQSKNKSAQLNLDVYEFLITATTVPEICDSLYLLIVKQIRQNPEAGAVKRAWQLISLCLTVFRPSEEFAPYLARFIELNTHIAKRYFCFELFRQRMRLGTIGPDQVPRLEKGFDLEEVLEERTPCTFETEDSLHLQQSSI